MVDRSALRLVAMTDNLRDGVAGLTTRAVAACRGGATMIHLRLPDEEPRTVVAATRALVRSVSVPVLVHGRVDIAVAVGAAGVHLGVRDITPDEARRVAGERFIIGRSLAGGVEARVGGADYVTVGPIFPVAEQQAGSALGLDGLTRVVRLVSVPVVAIGGISARTASDVLRAGATGVALISGIFGVTDPESATRQLRTAIET